MKGSEITEVLTEVCISFTSCSVKEKSHLGINGEEVEAEGKYRWVQNCQQPVRSEREVVKSA